MDKEKYIKIHDIVFDSSFAIPLVTGIGIEDYTIEEAKEEVITVKPIKKKRIRIREKKPRPPLTAGIKIDTPNHGTTSGYRDGCRCMECKLAKQREKRQWMEKRKLLKQM